MDFSPSYSILRVKRKADEAPLDALVIEESGRREGKRARTDGTMEEDGSGGLGMFRLVQTVQSGWVGRGEEGEALKTRIKDYQSSRPVQDVIPTSSKTGPSPAAFPTSLARLRVIKPVGRAVSNRMRMGDSTSSNFPSQDLRFIDAIQDTRMEISPPSPPRAGFMPSGAVMPDASRFMSKEDAEMLKMQEEYMPMLEEAMAAERQKQASSSSSKPTLPEPDMSKPVRICQPPMYLPQPSANGTIDWAQLSVAQNEDDGEYVYDLYFRDAPGMEGATTEGLVGALSGYEEMLEDEDGGDDTEEEDEADEDSNDEDHFKNDYPDSNPDDDDYKGELDADDQEDDRAYHNRNLRFGDDIEDDRDGFELEEEPEDHPVRRLIRRLQNSTLDQDARGADDDDDDE